MKNNEFIVYYNRNRVVTDIEDLSVELKKLSTIITPNNNHISNEEFLTIEDEITDFIVNTFMTMTNIVNKIKSERGGV